MNKNENLRGVVADTRGMAHPGMGKLGRFSPVIAIVAGSGLLISGCGTGEEPTAEQLTGQEVGHTQPAPATAMPNPTPPPGVVWDTTAVPSAGNEQGNSSESPSVQDLFQRPADAVPGTSLGHGSDGKHYYAAVKSPAGNITCQLWGDMGFDCRTTPDGQMAQIGQGQLRITPNGVANPPDFANECEAVQPGKSVYFGANVCEGVSDDSIACWNTEIGQGALIAPSGIEEL